jgi:hypothetical protein
MMVYGIYIYCIYNIIKRKYVHAVKLNQHSHHVWPKKWVKTRRSLRRRPARRARRREEVLVIEAMVSPPYGDGSKPMTFPIPSGNLT